MAENDRPPNIIDHAANPDHYRTILLALPAELLHMVLSYVDSNDLLTLADTCSLVRFTVQQPSLWRHVRWKEEGRTTNVRFGRPLASILSIEALRGGVMRSLSVKGNTIQDDMLSLMPEARMAQWLDVLGNLRCLDLEVHHLQTPFVRVLCSCAPRLEVIFLRCCINQPPIGGDCDFSDPLLWLADRLESLQCLTVTIPLQKAIDGGQPCICTLATGSKSCEATTYRVI